MNAPQNTVASMETRGFDSERILETVGVVGLVILNGLLTRPADHGSTGGIAGDPGWWLGIFVGSALVSAMVVMVVYAVARLAGAAKTRAGFMRLAFCVVAVLCVLRLVANTIPMDASPRVAVPSQPSMALVTDSDRGGLRLDQNVISHSTLGFSVPDPGADFRISNQSQREIDARLAEHPEMVSWMFKKVDAAEAIMIIVAKGAPFDEGGFRAFARGFRNSATAARNALVLQDDVVWNRTVGEYDLIAQLGPVYVKYRCLTGSPTRGVQAVCLQTVGRTSNSLDFVREGLTVEK